MGVNFWGDNTAARVRQKQWLAYQDGDDEAVMAVRLAWVDGHDPKELLEQDLFAAVMPGPDGETFFEVQTVFRPTAETLEFGKTNFGFFAVRVAKSISAFFGGGTLTNSAGATGEPAIFGKPATRINYSGQQQDGSEEGITYFDHSTHPGHPSAWHAREDGWMAASVCFAGARTTTKKEPLSLRYLLHAHRGPLDAKRADEVFRAFDKRPPFELVKAPAKHTAFAVKRKA
jgi:Family of unknown function (DUF6807)